MNEEYFIYLFFKFVCEFIKEKKKGNKYKIFT